MSAQEYEWLNDAGVVALRGTPNPSIIGGFEDWTQDSTSKAVTVTLTDPDAVPLAFKPPSGATADQTDQIEVYADDGTTLLFYVDASGNVSMSPESGSAVTLKQVMTANGDNHLGFFAATPVAKQAVTGALSTVSDAAAKAVLTSIIAALVAYGLATDSTT